MCVYVSIYIYVSMYIKRTHTQRERCVCIFLYIYVSMYIKRTHTQSERCVCIFLDICMCYYVGIFLFFYDKLHLISMNYITFYIISVYRHDNIIYYLKIIIKLMID